MKYDLIWCFKHAPHIQMTRCRKVYNVKTGRIIKMIDKNGSFGWNIDRRWISRYSVNENVVKIEKEVLPF